MSTYIDAHHTFKETIQVNSCPHRPDNRESKQQVKLVNDNNVFHGTFVGNLSGGSLVGMDLSGVTLTDVTVSGDLVLPGGVNIANVARDLRDISSSYDEVIGRINDEAGIRENADNEIRNVATNAQQIATQTKADLSSKFIALNRDVHTQIENVNSELTSLSNTISTALPQLSSEIKEQISALSVATYHDVSAALSTVTNQVSSISVNFSEALSALSTATYQDVSAALSTMHDQISSVSSELTTTINTTSQRIDQLSNDLSVLSVSTEAAITSLTAADSNLDQKITNVSAIVSSQISTLSDAIDTNTADIETALTSISEISTVTIPALARVVAEQVNITVECLDTPLSDSVETYIVKEAGVQVGAVIHIPNEFSTSCVSIETCSSDNDPVEGYKTGDKYIKFESSIEEASPVTVCIKDLIDINIDGDTNAAAIIVKTNNAAIYEIPLHSIGMEHLRDDLSSQVTDAYETARAAHNEITAEAVARFEADQQLSAGLADSISSVSADLSAEISCAELRLTTALDSLSGDLSGEISSSTQTLSTALTSDISSISTDLSNCVSSVSSSITADLSSVSSDLSSECSSAFEDLKSQISAKVFIQNSDDEEFAEGKHTDLSVIKLTTEEYYDLVYKEETRPNVVYFHGNDITDLYGEIVKNMTMTDDATPSEGATQHYVDSTLSTVSADVLISAAAQISETSSSITAEVSSVSSVIEANIESLSSSLTSIVSSVSSTITSDVSAISTDLIDDMSSISSSITAEVSSISTDVVGVISSVSSSITADLGSVSSTITSDVSSISTEITSDVQSVSTGLSSTISCISAAVYTAISAMTTLDEITDSSTFGELVTRVNTIRESLSAIASNLSSI